MNRPPRLRFARPPDRFKVAVHKEMKEVTVNVLTAGKTPKLTAASDSDQPARRINARRDAEGKAFLELIAGKATMATLAEMLQLSTNRPVLDRTGLTGQFNIKVDKGSCQWVFSIAG